ncbi:MAG TPA: hypothetical protein VMT10_04275 [Solirubrobacteraceae bacterium]|nr:hypothetical protein [Solirubrobacteraceae bacterium]
MRSHPLTGPLLVLAGALGLLLVSFLTWYSVDLGAISGGARFAARYAAENGIATNANAWTPWSTFAGIVLFGAIAAAAGLAIGGVATGARSMGAAAGAMGAGALASALIVLHIAARPQPHAVVTVTGWAWVGLLCAVLVLVGGFVWWDHTQHPVPAGSGGMRVRSAGPSGEPGSR